MIWRLAGWWRFHFATISLAFLKVPSPEQGTSAKTRSNFAMSGYFEASKLVKISYGVGYWITACISTWQRYNSTSFAHTSPHGPTCSRSCDVFEPGAAHMSKTFSPTWQLRNKGGNIETYSWRVNKPDSFNKIKNLFTTFSPGSLRSLSRDTSNVNAQVEPGRLRNTPDLRLFI